MSKKAWMQIETREEKEATRYQICRLKQPNSHGKSVQLVFHEVHGSFEV